MDFLSLPGLSLLAQALLYLLAGVAHLVRPKLYLPLMPPYLPAHKPLVLLSGVAEIVLGLGLLLPQARPLAAWGIIGMLLVFLSVHEWMLRARLAGTRYRSLPIWGLALRIPLQFALMYWAYLYT